MNEILSYLDLPKDIVTIEQFIRSDYSIDTVNQNGWSLAHYGADNNDTKLLKYLIQNGANMNLKTAQGWTPLYVAIKFCNDDAIEVLKDYEVDLSIDTFDILSRASKKTFKLLLSKGLDINCKDDDGNSLLHWSIEQKNMELIEFLLQNGADINIQNNFGWTPLYMAAHNGFVDIAKYLLQNGANPSIETKMGNIANLESIGKSSESN